MSVIHVEQCLRLQKKLATNTAHAADDIYLISSLLSGLANDHSVSRKFANLLDVSHSFTFYMQTVVGADM